MFLKGAFLSPVALRKTGGVDDGCSSSSSSSSSSSRRFVSVNAADASVRPPLPLILPMLHFFLLRCRRASTSSHTQPPSLSVVVHSLLGAETDRAELLACPTWERAHSSTVDTPTRHATPHPAHDRDHNHYDSRRRHYRDHIHLHARCKSVFLPLSCSESFLQPSPPSALFLPHSFPMMYASFHRLGHEIIVPATFPPSLSPWQVSSHPPHSFSLPSQQLSPTRRMPRPPTTPSAPSSQTSGW